MRVEFKTREIRKLIFDLDRTPARKHDDFRKVVRDGAGMLTVLAKQNARDTAGEHGSLYPRTIGYDTYDGGLTAEIGPDVAMPQGGMSFEYGSRNQPPHLDLNRAADDVARVFPKMVRDAAGLDL